jgi:hypothetical protein
MWRPAMAGPDVYIALGTAIVLIGCIMKLVV